MPVVVLDLPDQDVNTLRVLLLVGASWGTTGISTPHVSRSSAVWDGAASLLIGLLLMVVAYLLMRRNLALLIDEAAPAEVRERLGQAVAKEPWVVEVAELTAVYIGPKQLLVLIHVVPVDGTDLTANVGRLRHRLLAVPAIAAVEITPVERAH
jgi:divalent metal cation (Fe/Co/Zn/Cd) transporter